MGASKKGFYFDTAFKCRILSIYTRISVGVFRRATRFIVLQLGRSLKRMYSLFAGATVTWMLLVAVEALEALSRTNATHDES